MVASVLGQYGRHVLNNVVEEPNHEEDCVTIQHQKTAAKNAWDPMFRVRPAILKAALVGRF
jgi:hypothetical protein